MSHNTACRLQETCNIHLCLSHFQSKHRLQWGQHEKPLCLNLNMNACKRSLSQILGYTHCRVVTVPPLSDSLTPYTGENCQIRLQNVGTSVQVTSHDKQPDQMFAKMLSSSHDDLKLSSSEGTLYNAGKVMFLSHACLHDCMTSPSYKNAQESLVPATNKAL